MESFANTVRSNIIVQAILFIALGLFLLLMPGVTVVTIIYLLGVVFALSGVASLIGYFRQGGAHSRMPSVLTTGVFMLILALVVFIFPEVIAGFFSVALGIVLMLCGIVNAVRSFELRHLGGSAWIAALVISILIALGGVVIIWNPFDTTVLFVMVLGGLLLANGIADLVIEVMARRNMPQR